MSFWGSSRKLEAELAIPRKGRAPPFYSTTFWSPPAPARARPPPEERPPLRPRGLAHLGPRPRCYRLPASILGRRNPLAFHGFPDGRDTSAFAAGTGSGSSEGNRISERVTGEAGDLGRARHQARRPHRSARFELLAFGMASDFPVHAQAASKRSSSEKTTQ